MVPHDSIDAALHDLQDAAEYLGVDFDSRQIFEVNCYQYRRFAAPSVKQRVRQSDYALQRSADLLEVMATFYRGPGGRSNGTHY